MNKILTVSVAAYHVEQYLAQCLDSFLIPEAEDLMEVLIINDGSGEGVSEIAREYERRYPDVFRLIDKENGGHGSTVNRGIAEASGKYFKTVDGDDYVRQEGLRQLVQFLASAQVDLVVTGYESFRDADGQTIGVENNDFKGRKTYYSYQWEDISDQIYINMHAATYRTSILRNMKSQLDEHCYYVDAQYNLYPVPYIQTVAFLEKPVYMYRLGMETQSMNIRNMQKNCSHHEKVLAHLLDYYEECRGGMSPARRQYMAKGIARILVSQIKIYLSFPTGKHRKKQIKDMDTEIKRKYPEVYRHVSNGAVKLLRLSGYLLYPLAASMCQKVYHCKDGGEKE